MPDEVVNLILGIVWMICPLQSLLSLHAIGTTHNDANLCDYLESEFLQEQVDASKELGDLLTNIRRVGKDGLGIFMFDKEFKS